MRFTFSMFVITTITLCVGALSATAGEVDEPQFVRSYPPEMKGARAEVYKVVPAKQVAEKSNVPPVKLKAYIFDPPGHSDKDSRPAIVFFFGGGWSAGSPGQFYSQCRHLAKRGMVAMTVDYRVRKRHDALPADCVRDAKTAIKWVRANANRLGVDPKRVVAAGGSAGGHLAAAVGTLDGFEEKEHADISAVPNAMVLFNPAVVLANSKGVDLLPAEKVKTIDQKTQGNSLEISPYQHLKSGVAPTIIFHGTNDDAVPFPTVVAYTKKMQSLGNRCELVPFKDQPHGFFNPGRGPKDDPHSHYKDTVARMDAFLVSLGYLPAAK